MADATEEERGPWGGLGAFIEHHSQLFPDQAAMAHKLRDEFRTLAESPNPPVDPAISHVLVLSGRYDYSGRRIDPKP